MKPYRTTVVTTFLVKQIAWAMARAGLFTIVGPRRHRVVAPCMLEVW